LEYASSSTRPLFREGQDDTVCNFFMIVVAPMAVIVGPWHQARLSAMGCALYGLVPGTAWARATG
jgi:hypothetical protein